MNSSAAKRCHSIAHKRGLQLCEYHNFCFNYCLHIYNNPCFIYFECFELMTNLLNSISKSDVQQKGWKENM